MAEKTVKGLYTRVCVVCGKTMITDSARKIKCSHNCLKIYEKAYNKERYPINKKSTIEKIKQYRQTEEGAEKHRKEASAYYYKNRKRILAKTRTPEYRKKKNAWFKEWFKKNPEKLKVRSAHRRSLCKDLKVETVQRVYEDNIKKYGTLTCFLCGKSIKFKEDSLEHVMPLSRGGSNDYENLKVAHRKCNYSKGYKTLEEWNKWRS